jgi:hypothetical protein
MTLGKQIEKIIKSQSDYVNKTSRNVRINTAVGKDLNYWGHLSTPNRTTSVLQCACARVCAWFYTEFCRIESRSQKYRRSGAQTDSSSSRKWIECFPYVIELAIGAHQIPAAPNLLQIALFRAKPKIGIYCWSHASDWLKFIQGFKYRVRLKPFHFLRCLAMFVRISIILAKSKTTL